MPVRIPITRACGDYDRTRAIKDGRVTVEGCDVTYLPMELEGAVERRRVGKAHLVGSLLNRELLVPQKMLRNDRQRFAHDRVVRLALGRQSTAQ